MHGISTIKNEKSSRSASMGIIAVCECDSWEQRKEGRSRQMSLT